MSSPLIRSTGLLGQLLQPSLLCYTPCEQWCLQQRCISTYSLTSDTRHWWTKQNVFIYSWIKNFLDEHSHCARMTHYTREMFICRRSQCQHHRRLRARHCYGCSAVDIHSQTSGNRSSNCRWYLSGYSWCQLKFSSGRNSACSQGTHLLCPRWTCPVDTTTASTCEHERASSVKVLVIIDDDRLSATIRYGPLTTLSSSSLSPLTTYRRHSSYVSIGVYMTCSNRQSSRNHWLFPASSAGTCWVADCDNLRTS